MGRLVHIRRRQEGERYVLYYFTDYVPPIRKLCDPISECVEGFVEIDKTARTVRIKECSPGLEESPKRWIIECVMMMAKKALSKSEYPGILDFQS